MSEQTDPRNPTIGPAPGQPPQPSRIMAEPATPANCAQDYADGAGDRAAIDKQVR